MLSRLEELLAWQNEQSKNKQLEEQRNLMLSQIQAQLEQQNRRAIAPAPVQQIAPVQQMNPEMMELMELLKNSQNQVAVQENNKLLMRVLNELKTPNPQLTEILTALKQQQQNNMSRAITELSQSMARIPTELQELKQQQILLSQTIQLL